MSFFSGDTPPPVDKVAEEANRQLAISVVNQICAIEEIIGVGRLGEAVLLESNDQPRIKIEDMISNKKGTYLVVGGEVYVAKAPESLDLNGQPRIKIEGIASDSKGPYLTVDKEAYDVKASLDKYSFTISLPNDEYELFASFISAMDANGDVFAIQAFDREILHGLPDQPRIKQSFYGTKTDGTIEDIFEYYYNNDELQDLALKWKKTHTTRLENARKTEAEKSK